MVDGVIPADKIQDPQGINSGAELSRDPCRTPFQWSEVPYAGFSTVEPWLPVAEGYEQRNVAAQQVDPHSVLNLYKRLLAYRKSTPALQQGAYHTVTDTPDTCYAYLREYDGQRRLIVLSFADAEQTLALDAIADRGKVAVSSGLDREGEDLDLSRLRLGAHEGLIIEI